MVIDRGAFLSGRLGQVFDEVVAVKEAVARRTSRSSSKRPNSRPTTTSAGPAGSPCWAARTSSRPRPARPACRRRCPTRSSCSRRCATSPRSRASCVGVKVAGGIRNLEGRPALSGAGERDGGRELAHAGSVPLRRVVAPERSPHAAPQAAHRRLRPSRRVQWRLMSDDLTSPLGSTDLRPRAGVGQRSRTFARATGSLSMASSPIPSSHASFETLNPATEDPLARVAQASSRGRRSRRCRRAPRLRQESGRRRPAPSARSISTASRDSSRSARANSPSSRRSTTASRSASRATSTCRSAAAHFFYYAGWADKLDYAGFGPSPKPLGVAGQIIPVELSAAHGGVEARAGARGGKHLRPEARRDDAAHGARARRDSPAGRAASGRGQHRDRRRHDGRRTGRSPRRRQDRLHRFDRGGSTHSAARRAGRTSTSRSSSAARARTSSSRTRPSTR